MSFQKRWLWTASLMAMLLLMPRSALALQAGINIDVHQDIQCIPGQNCPNDFHVEGIICSKGGPPVLVDHVDGIFSPPNGNFSYSITYLGTPDPCYYKFVADWWLNPPMSLQGIPYCTVLHLGLLFDVDAANLMLDLQAWWTRDGKRMGEVIPLGNGGFVPLVGFSVNDDGGTAGQSIRIGNGSVIMPPEPGPPEIPIKIIQMDVVAFPAATPPNFRDLQEGGAQQYYPWIGVANASGPISPTNPITMAPDSFFDVFLEVFQPGQPHPLTVMTIPPGGFLVARQLVQFTNNNGEMEQRWDWEIHGAQPAEACCFNDGSCQDLAPFDCLRAGGHNKGAGTTCANVVCLPQGACCYGTAAPMCMVTDQATCQQQLLGVWKGVGTDCTDADGDGIADVCEKPVATMDFGDAPEGALAYPATGVMGQFPTCMTVGPATWVQHTNFGAWFGPAVDFEMDGNAGLCPLFAPYDADECMNDGDAGLIMPGAYTIQGLLAVPCPQSSASTALGTVCQSAQWGINVDIHLQNMMPSQAWGYVNVIMDWDQSGTWGGSSPCPLGAAPEHVLVNFPVPPGFAGPLSALGPPGFLIGPNSGFVWARFTVSERPVATGWDGSGMFEDGESEDYLLKVNPAEDLWDFGDAPDPAYPTLLASNGARHRLGSGLLLGGLIDSEGDGQPDPTATGDDLAGIDDEDGVTFSTALFSGVPNIVTVVVTNPGTGPARLDAWIDYNGNGSWADAGEQIFASVAVNNGTNSLSFTPGAITAVGQTFARFRLSSQGGLSFTGAAPDGEVEDYQIKISPVKWLQRPDTAFTGVDVDLSETELADDFRCTMSGPITDLHIWTSFRYDLTPVPLNSLMFRLTLYTDVPAGLDRPYSHPGSAVWSRVYPAGAYNAGLCANVPNGEWWYTPSTNLWVYPGDFQIYQYDFYIPQAEAFVQHEGRIYWLGVQCLGGVTQSQIGWKSSLAHWNDDAVWFDQSTGIPGWRELRYGDGHPMVPDSMDLAFAVTGEPGTPPEEDFGDAPDPSYPTKLPNGASHIIVPGMFLGASVDAESDGQPNAAATGDDLAGVDDEDGVTFLNTLARGRTVKVAVVASVAGMLDAWVDFGRDGAWSQPGDQIFASMPLAAGNNILSFVVPTSAVLGQTFARFRYSTAGGLSYSGLAFNGEVEDYMVEIRPAKIVGRYVFYNNSYYDGNKIAIDPAPIGGANNDDADAIDTSKTPLFSGTATFANWTGFAQGINGLIYEVQDVMRPPVAADFTFSSLGRTGTSAPVIVTPSAFLVQTDTPVVGTTRVIVTFPSVGGLTPSGSVQNTWLQVAIGAGFGSASEVHYWGNARYDCGTVSGASIVVNATDEIEARNNQSGFIIVPVTNRWDYNKDGRVNATDQIGPRNNPSGFTPVMIITK